jgi:hypothetical protein
MKLTKFVLCSVVVLSANLATGQKSEQQEILNEFGLSINDHRGVIFTSDPSIAQSQFPNGTEAITGFFGTTVKRDLTYINVIDQKGLPINEPLSVIDLVDLYIELTNENQIEENEK